MKTSHILWSALAALALTGNASAASFSNGSFESPGGGPGTRDLIANPGVLSPWVHGGSATDLYEASGQDGQTAQDGSFFVGFGHSGTTGGTLSQTFDTLAGQIYTVTYYTAKQQDGSPADAARFNLKVVDAGTSTQLVSQDGSVLGTNWVQQTVPFVALGTSSTLTFTDLGGTIDPNAGAYNLSVDNFSVTAAVPEPATVAMFTLGLLGVGAARRRQRG